MSITNNLQGVRRLFLDTAPVIYFVEQHPKYFHLSLEVFKQIQNTPLIGVVSPITLAECLVQPYRLKQTELQQEFIELMTENDNIEFVGFINETIAIEAAQIRARYNLQLPDALQIAVALNAECEAFLTNDLTFKRITELRVLVLNDFNNAV
ncbi:PIN domain-containing protein [Aphanizomenon flos-aquae NRERC-008]|uniref:PIN domain-containing protein n=1 Tax=Aphanizomenon flos-aquae FACHB-1249 TaxID=2692889 RepID=A0ABR8IQ03_APHFL|nr:MULTISPECIES: PIN domain-containing protein [Aphanizomenon]MBD2391762.1 PIN domain-containing protein [Aphanizomenon flos-aquae FACHB-1171]MBD2557432.1 PIN domain-containing protein [Aphanizomenon flos-aquae FACHB-1290]MBD2632324.1 PIN domain-containing protein [Aphanizomenon sp. FACHB-1399]MBD2657183.1 PIN domain-containing protein [Aphanizomenon flos-aquae FACHB-1265]MBD2674861.1 PIN domain-containing protein [Aphanizomenon flos-aquae FACHB-1416]MBD2684685.1 PIN domain-containing protein